MESGLSIETSLRLYPAEEASIDLYIQLGKQTYNEHYLHLWKDGIPSAYFETFYTPDKVRSELANPKLSHYIIEKKQTPIGIVKLNTETKSLVLPDQNTVLLEKIYILNAYSGNGIGSRVIEKIENLVKTQGRTAIWLETMKRGKALTFYLNKGYQVLGERQLHYKNIKEEERPMFILGKLI
ncbi:MAG: GNAT family N-acetyltransferase [Eudoraea sp.]|nr:GNAT family N-acetyltransferase [Eudoraea sp.]